MFKICVTDADTSDNLYWDGGMLRRSPERGLSFSSEGGARAYLQKDFNDPSSPVHPQLWDDTTVPPTERFEVVPV